MLAAAKRRGVRLAVVGAVLFGVCYGIVNPAGAFVNPVTTQPVYVVSSTLAADAAWAAVSVGVVPASAIPVFPVAVGALALAAEILCLASGACGGVPLDACGPGIWPTEPDYTPAAVKACPPPLYWVSVASAPTLEFIAWEATAAARRVCAWTLAAYGGSLPTFTPAGESADLVEGDSAMHTTCDGMVASLLAAGAALVPATVTPPPPVTTPVTTPVSVPTRTNQICAIAGQFFELGSPCSSGGSVPATSTSNTSWTFNIYYTGGTSASRNGFTEETDCLLGGTVTPQYFTAPSPTYGPWGGTLAAWAQGVTCTGGATVAGFAVWDTAGAGTLGTQTQTQFATLTATKTAVTWWNWTAATACVAGKVPVGGLCVIPQVQQVPPPSTHTTPPQTVPAANPASNDVLTQVGNFLRAGLDDVVNAVQYGLSLVVNAVGLVVNAITQLWTDLLTWLQSAYDSIVNLMEQTYNMMQGLLQAVVGQLVSLGAQVLALPALIATALATALQSLFIPTYNPLTDVQAKAAGKFPFNIVTGVSNALPNFFGLFHTSGSLCGPTVGFAASDVHLPSGSWLPAQGFHFQAPSPSNSGCPGTGPGGARTNNDNQAGDVFGAYRAIRAALLFSMAFGLAIRLIRSSPWSRLSDGLTPNAGAGDDGESISADEGIRRSMNGSARASRRYA